MDNELVSGETRRCARCKLEKPLAEFRGTTRQTKSGPKVYYSYCIPCEREYSTEHYAANKAKRSEQRKAWDLANPEKLRGYWLKGTYGITLEHYDELLAAQGGVCAICKGTQDVYCVDHDHGHCRGDKGCKDCVRGLLCRDCNLALGKFGDDLATVERAVAYLRGEH